MMSLAGINGTNRAAELISRLTALDYGPYEDIILAVEDRYDVHLSNDPYSMYSMSDPDGLDYLESLLNAHDVGDDETFNSLMES